MIGRDFEYIRTLLHDFFAIKSIRDKLNLIDEYGITGWETWMQVEFAAFLCAQNGDWEREGRYLLDRRMSLDKFYFKPDFILRKKGWGVDTYVALEFKQNSQPAACIRNMVLDLEKVAKARRSEVNLRSVWAIGVTSMLNIDENELVELAKTYVNPKYFELKSQEKHIYARPIRKTNYGFILM